jgi:hypothetical protein
MTLAVDLLEMVKTNPKVWFAAETVLKHIDGLPH